MAESKSSEGDKRKVKSEANDESLHSSRVFTVEGEEQAAVPAALECAICLQMCVHPAQLPCGHVFCFLCVKGVANQSKKCAMCRQEIPSDYLERPQLLEQAAGGKEAPGFDDGHQWFYEGRNGWWQYDERTSRELEAAYKRGERHCELLIAGFLYVADFDAMLQLRRNDPSRRRRIKRDLATIPKKGVAGLRLEGEAGPPKAVSTALDLAAQQLHSLTLHDSSDDDEDEAPPPLAPWMVPLSSSDEEKL
ncbi:E3 ubiquitin-protein ligase rnf146-like isoform X2 [Bacillus rossius redtenbacheri]|uniref:E3 ubiquitin-protein ligase rnf146-like isoform X2 n=1 Tax=Bacillus rossius redtenbacheri TaxID=93214 RepID=UPI002FDCB74F